MTVVLPSQVGGVFLMAMGFAAGTSWSGPRAARHFDETAEVNGPSR